MFVEGVPLILPYRDGVALFAPTVGVTDNEKYRLGSLMIMWTTCLRCLVDAEMHRLEVKLSRS